MVMQLIESYATLPESFFGFSKTAEIRISADGKYLYCSNRGHDSITRYAIDAEDGRLNLLGCSPCEGSTPRNFIIDPSDTFLFCANSASNAVTVFYLDQLSGDLVPAGTEIPIGKPMCMVFFQA